jgi:hypothetical protein
LVPKPSRPNSSLHQARPFLYHFPLPRSVPPPLGAVTTVTLTEIRWDGKMERMLRPRKQQRVGGDDACAGGGRGGDLRQGIGAHVPEREMESCIGRNARQATSLVNDLGFAVFPSVVPRSVSQSCCCFPHLLGACFHRGANPEALRSSVLQRLTRRLPDS